MKIKQPNYLFYGLPGLPLAALGLPLYIYLPTFYAEQLGLGLSLVGILLLLSRITDVISDPIIGYIADRLPFNYRRKILIGLATPLLMVAIWALFVPPESVTGTWLLTWSVLVYIAWTLITLPYMAWGAELSSDYDQRTSVTASREALVLMGTLSAASLPLVMGIGSDQPGQALTLLAKSLLIILPIAVGLCFWKVIEKSATSRPIGFLDGLILLKGNTLFKRLLFAYFMNGIANGLPATLFLLYVTHVLAMPEKFGLLLSVYFMSGLVGLPIGLQLAKKFSKHRIWSVSMLWSVFIFSWVPFLGEGDFIPFMIVCVLSGLSLAIDMALPSSIQADVIDIDSQQGGGQRAGFFFGIWGMTTKLSLALAVGIAFPLLSLLGFDTRPDYDSNNLIALSLIYGLLPIPFKVVAGLLMWNFPLNRKQHRSVQASLS
jgi:GPH family glycoside/pentoside/hexuronide:cation symporter